MGDITPLRFSDQEFKCVLVFGLYHNLEHGLDVAISETYRVLATGGVVCASCRADNIQTRFTDYLSGKKKKNGEDEREARLFHKMNLNKKEYGKLFTRAGFVVDSILPVENMPVLYKFRFFRSSGHIEFDENLARAEGYRLSWFRQKLQDFLMKFFPDQFCNVYVLTASK